MHFMEYVAMPLVQVWKQPKVWQGFVKCCEVNKAVLRCENFCHI